jgi:hypothetical protein
VNPEKHKLLEDILMDARRDPEFFEEVLEHSGITQRSLMQLYMMYKFKHDFGKEIGRDPRWEGATAEFIQRGHAEKFAQVYDGRLSVKTTYERLFGATY